MIHVNYQLKNFNCEQQEFIKEAAEHLEAVINSNDFKVEIELGFFLVNGKLFIKRKQLYKELTAGDINLDLTAYRVPWWKPTGRKTRAYTKPSTKRIWLNERYLTDVRQVAGTLIHEHLHNLGYTHSRKRHSQRKHSIPYAVGEIVTKFKGEMQARLF